MSREVLAYWEENAVIYRDSAYKFDAKLGRYPFYETRLALIEDMVSPLPKAELLDAGCGGGSVLIHFLQNGWSGRGCDGAQAMVDLAHENLAKAGFDPALVHRSDVTALAEVEDGSLDLVISAGVMEYLTEDEEVSAFAETRRVLRPGGHFVVENINELFDIATFNRFTVEFFSKHVLPEFFDEPSMVEALTDRITQLITHPDKPDRSGTYSTTRDQVFTKAEVPLDYGRKCAERGFRQIDQGFYRFHAVPPLLFDDEPSLEHVTIRRELSMSRHWLGNLLASGFISLLVKE